MSPADSVVIPYMRCALRKISDSSASDSRFLTDKRSFAHEFRVSNYVCWPSLIRSASREQRKTIDQPPAAPIDKLLPYTVLTVAQAQRSKQVSAHARIAM